MLHSKVSSHEFRTRILSWPAWQQFFPPELQQGIEPLLLPASASPKPRRTGQLLDALLQLQPSLAAPRLCRVPCVHATCRDTLSRVSLLRFPSFPTGSALPSITARFPDVPSPWTLELIAALASTEACFHTYRYSTL